MFEETCQKADEICYDTPDFCHGKLVNDGSTMIFMLIGQKHLLNSRGTSSMRTKIKCPQNLANQAEKQVMQGRARAHHEMINGRLEELVSFHRSSATNVFWACAVAMVTQLTMENGEPLFEVEYLD